ncbi:hypothetical protein PybrP1_011040 [[Pythium] brassicae (nom. inval.)]|nr:hypothetical protein PybrP1_011040 [[Pythium] brassicae (nom. inval.)]
MAIQTGHRVGVAFALTFAAGFATVVGNCIAFNKRLMHLANPASLAIALALSAGISPEHHATEVGSLENVAIEEELKAMKGAVMSAAKKRDEYVLPEGTKKAANEENAAKRLAEEHKLALQRVGLLSAIAIGIHNMPEGIATYVGAAQDSSVGFSLAFGIEIHNTPEGIAIAAPDFSATGSRSRAISQCTVSALAEPLGGLIAWLAIGDGMDPISEGILFGFVCGIMVCICMKELLPTAFRFAKNRDHLVTLSAFGGMGIMATSLILFAYARV